MKPSKIIDNENEKVQINISVRNLVEFILNSGDIDDRHGGKDTMEAMQAGSRMHRKLQKRSGEDYHAEVPLKFVVSYEEYDLGIEGRADGIIYDIKEDDSAPNGERIVHPMIDEIKGMYTDVLKFEEPEEVHLAQAKCYGFIFAIQNQLEEITVQITYCNLDTEEIKRFQEKCSYEELEEWFQQLILKYKRWSDFQYQWRITRQESILNVQFPYEYRPGQKQLASDVYRSIAREKILFIQAPTGTGKTISTIFPAVKAVGENLGDKIFYLTAKTATALVARDTFAQLRAQGYRGKSIMIVAKDKMCFLEERQCNPDACPYAKGHYDRVNDAVYDLLQERDQLDRDTILDWARERKVCPFEMCLDVANWADNIICDYNYVFDPNVYLKRFFAEGIPGEYIFLVDEAHNLVDRAREMYSESIVKEEILAMKKILKNYSKKIERALERCNRLMLQWKRECEKMLALEDIDQMIFALMNVGAAMDELLEKDITIEDKDEVLDFYFKVRNFLNLSEGLDEHYRLYCDYNEHGEFVLHMFCVDPSLLLQDRIDRGNASVFFSATLLPVQYYKELLCTEPEPYAVYAQSVFDTTKRALFIANDVSSKYTRRGDTEYRKYASYMKEIISAKQGNYMAFFPSYRFMEDVLERFLEMELDVDVIYQTNNMKEADREDFLGEFDRTRDKTLIAFCVLGGVFSEGIDLVNDKLIGAIIAGAGLPQVGNEREVMKQHFDANGHNGFDYAYLYPGMNKVIQAAGRVIRTTEDTGIVALLDERFLFSEYKKTFPREWEGYEVCQINNINSKLLEFWSKVK